MSKARIILVALICASPVTLLWDGLIVQGFVVGIVAIATAIIAQTLRSGETEFLISIIRPVVAVAAIPAVWMLIQIIPLGAFAHPIWQSLETALGRPVVGAISIDPGASVVAFGQYICIAAVGLVSAAVAVDRQRAEWILFALTAAGATIALILLANELINPGSGLGPLTRAQAIDCAAMGAIIGTAACVRTIERYETRRANPLRSVPLLLRTFLASSVALAICASALFLDGTAGETVATGCGIAALACIVIIRRVRLGAWYALITVVTIGVAVFIVAAQQTQPSRSPLLAFAASPTAISERVLDDAPYVGTGAGTFAALAPIYRETDDPVSGSVASTTVAALAIELGRPMLWLIFAASLGCIIMLLRAALRRRRDSFYSAMGGSCLITLTALALVNAGLLATPTSLMAAAALGLAFGQSKSRTVKPPSLPA